MATLLACVETTLAWERAAEVPLALAAIVFLAARLCSREATVCGATKRGAWCSLLDVRDAYMVSDRRLVHAKRQEPHSW